MTRVDLSYMRSMTSFPDAHRSLVADAAPLLPFIRSVNAGTTACIHCTIRAS